MAVRLDPFRNIVKVHWNPMTEAPTELTTEFPTEPHSGTEPNVVHFQISTGNSQQDLMCYITGTDTLITWGVLTNGIMPTSCIPNGTITVTLFEDNEGRPRTYGFYTVTSYDPIIFPNGEPLPWDPSYDTFTYTDENDQIVPAGSRYYRYYEPNTEWS